MTLSRKSRVDRAEAALGARLKPKVCPLLFNPCPPGQCTCVFDDSGRLVFDHYRAIRALAPREGANDDGQPENAA